jgi:hypothetical protein
MMQKKQMMNKQQMLLVQQRRCGRQIGFAKWLRIHSHRRKKYRGRVTA